MSHVILSQPYLYFIESSDYHPLAVALPKKSSLTSSKIPPSNSVKYDLRSNQRQGGKEPEIPPGMGTGGGQNRHVSSNGRNRVKTLVNQRKEASLSEPSPPPAEYVSDDGVHVVITERRVNGSSQNIFPTEKSFEKDGLHRTRISPCLDDIESQQDCASGGSSVRPLLQSQPKVIS